MTRTARDLARKVGKTVSFDLDFGDQGKNEVGIAETDLLIGNLEKN